jgi:hypothetical protein
MAKGVSSPALSGNSARMDIGGQTVYADVLWNNHLIGDFSSRGLPDPDHAIIPNVHNFTYDVYFYATDLSVSQALEFDINQFVNGQSFTGGMNAGLREDTNGTSGTIRARNGLRPGLRAIP